MDTSLIKVSALLVGQNRPQIWESIDCFARQTHPNRELVVVIDDPDPEFNAAMAARAAQIPGMIVHCAPGTTPLGGLRNISLDLATGDYLVQWDDDDLYAPARIEWQLGKMLETGAQVSYLTDYTHHFLTDGQVFPCHWHNGFPGSLMFHRSLDVRYQTELDKHEDTFIKLKLREMGVPMVLLNNPPSLYTYRFHGSNTWSQEHHEGTAQAHLAG